MRLKPLQVNGLVGLPWGAKGPGGAGVGWVPKGNHVTQKPKNPDM
jgi:hypothetical protein